MQNTLVYVRTAIYIRENFKAKIFCSSKTEQFGKPLKPEYLFCSVWEGNSTPTLNAAVYRPPHVNIRSDDKFIELLRTYSSDYSHKVIIGDWNANILDSNDSDTRFLTNLITDLSLKLVNTGASHHSKKKITLALMLFLWITVILFLALTELHQSMEIDMILFPLLLTCFT